MIETIIIFAVAFVLTFLVVRTNGNWHDVLPQLLFSLITQAEREFGSGTGQLKLAKVIEWVLPKVPAILRPFVTVGKLTQLINDALTAAKLKWCSNAKLVDPLAHLQGIILPTTAIQQVVSTAE